ncbi:sortase [Streptococcus varani]|uniref:Sortase n=1 Tax=Streptococcus varani TaxID=1608583 RepID=A0A0E4H476_9STRE|nr:class B sortase [Streptococcus varani]CQR25030.1 sortase [Streptococcus varani]
MKRLFKCLGVVVLFALLSYGFYYLSRFEEDVGERTYHDKKTELFHQNPDVYAWLRVEGTKIDYPVAQHPTEDSYYLSHDLDRNETYYGAIFTELVNTKTFNDSVTIIYGHAMVDDSMFGSLDYFADRQFFKDHTLITIDTIDHHYEYDIVAAHPYVDDHLFQSFQLGTRSGLTHYLDTLKERVETNGGSYRFLPIEKDKDRFLILSTCDAVNNNQRYVVTARLRTITERTDT